MEGRWHLIPGTLISCRGGIYIQHNHLNFDLHNAVIFGHGEIKFTCIVKVFDLVFGCEWISVRNFVIK